MSSTITAISITLVWLSWLLVTKLLVCSSAGQDQWVLLPMQHTVHSLCAHHQSVPSLVTVSLKHFGHPLGQTSKQIV